MQCSSPQCLRPLHAKGLCHAHYMRARRGKSLDTPARHRKVGTKHGDPLRFINDIALPYSGEECLIWPFVRSSDGYARVRIPGRSNVASRYICELIHGEAPSENHEAAFLCANGRGGCVNPRHLAWRSRTENIQIKVAESRSARGAQMPKAKLSEQEVREIRRAFPSTTISDLASAYRVSRATIYDIIKGRKWSWVPE